MKKKSIFCSYFDDTEKYNDKNYKLLKKANIGE